MCWLERNTESRGRPLDLTRIWWRTRWRRRPRGEILVWAMVSVLLLLAFLAHDLLAQIHNALALVRLRLAEGADFRRHLTHALLVGAGDLDGGRLVAFDLDVGGDREHDVVAVAELELQRLALDRGTIADAADLERLAVALRHAGQHAAHEVAGGAPHHAGLLGLAHRLDPDLVVLELHLDLAREPHRELAQLALRLDLPLGQRDGHAARHGHGVFANSRHRPILRTRGREFRRRHWPRAPRCPT